MQIQSVDLDGPVSYADFGGRGPEILLVHGLGGSKENWLAVGPELARFGRVRALDLAGFGGTPIGANRTAHIDDNLTLIDRFIESVIRRPVVLIGNSMGGMLSVAEAAKAPDKVAGLVLVDPAHPLTLNSRVDWSVLGRFALVNTPKVGEHYMRRLRRQLGPTGMVRMFLGLCCSDLTRIPQWIVDAHDQLQLERATTAPWADHAFIMATRSVISLMLRPWRYAELVRRVVAPTLIVQGDHDRLVPVGSIRRLARSRPDWRLEIFEGVGHVPMLEAPDRFVQTVEGWLGTAARSPYATFSTEDMRYPEHAAMIC